MITDSKLDFWINNNMNVIFKGKHGVGKTSIVKSAFERNGLNWMYFSASTMDPWVDFIGVPKEKDGSLILIRPEAFSEDNIDALFFDEFNRSKDKVRNAVMELIQFKSINGKKFNNLKMIWAAINPDDDDDEDEMNYDVETLDPAQLDRFHVMVDLPYKPSSPYFKSKYGVAGAGAIEWWNELPKKDKNDVSPRRLEYALQYHSVNGDIRDILPKTVNISKLIQKLNIGPIKTKLASLENGGNEDEISEAFSNINFTTDAIEYIISDDKYISKFIQYVPKDMVSNLIVSSPKKGRQKLLSNTPIDFLEPIVSDIIASKSCKQAIKNELVRYMNDNNMSGFADKAHFTMSIKRGLRNYMQNTSTRYGIAMDLIAYWSSDFSIDVYKEVLLLVFLIISRSQDGTVLPESSTIGPTLRKIIIRLKKECKKQDISFDTFWDSVINNRKYKTKLNEERIIKFKGTL